MTSGATKFVPHTSTGWVGTGLGFGVIVVLVATYFLSQPFIDGGNTAAPLWLRIVTPAVVVAVAIPATVLGFRARRTDRSLLGTIALVIAVIIGGWALITGIGGFFL